MKKLILLLMLVGVCAAASAQQSEKPTPVIFETDMGNDIDDAIALDLLFKNVDCGKIDLLGVGVHKNNPHSAEFIDIMRVWYGYEKMPIGVNEKWITDMECNDYCTKVCKLTSADGKPMFARSKNPKYEDAFEVMPFNTGYFMCVRPKGIDAESVRKHLIEKYSTGTIVLSGLIRLAFSTIPRCKLAELFANVYSAINDLRA
jgi:hypothetical protein